MIDLTTAGTVPQTSRHVTPLTCKLRPKLVTGRYGPISNMGEVELLNCSDAPLEIEYTMTPLQFLDLEVSGPGGEIVSETHFSDRFSPTCQPTVLRLQPGEKFTADVPLLATVPREKRHPGTYTVQASYRFLGNRIMAAPLTLELTDVTQDASLR